MRGDRTRTIRTFAFGIGIRARPIDCCLEQRGNVRIDAGTPGQAQLAAGNTICG